MSIPFREWLQGDGPVECLYCGGVTHNRKCLQCGASHIRTGEGWHAIHDDTTSTRYIVLVCGIAVLLVLLVVTATV